MKQNWPKNLVSGPEFIFFHFLLLEEYEQGVLRKEPVIATFIKRFEKATLRMSYRQIPLVIRVTYLAISYLLALC